MLGEDDAEDGVVERLARELRDHPLAEMAVRRMADVMAGRDRDREPAVEPELFMGILYYDRGETKRAEDIFEALYEKNPSEGLADIVTLLYWARFQDFRQGLMWAERLPDGFLKEFWKAAFLGSLGRHIEALEVAKKLPAMKPDAALGAFFAAVAYMNAGDFKKAEALARRARGLAPKKVEKQMLADFPELEELNVPMIGRK